MLIRRGKESRNVKKGKTKLGIRNRRRLFSEFTSWGEVGLQDNAIFPFRGGGGVK